MVMLYGNTAIDSRGIVTNPSTANYIQSGVVVNPKTLQANPVLSPYGYAGAAPFGALQGAVNSLVSGLMSPRPAAPRPAQPQMPLQGGVSTARPVSAPAPTTYNQPYAPVTNVRNTSVNIPDLFKSTPMIPPSSMDFQSLSPMPAAQAARISTGAGSAPLPAAVSMGVQSLPMTAASAPVTVAQGSSPVTLQAQQAKTDQPLPPVSPEPISRPSRPIEMPPVAPRYAPPPMAAPMMNPYAQPAAPMPPAPMYSPPFNPGQFMPNLQPPRQFYQPPAPQRTDFMGRLGRGLQRMGEGLNPNIASANMARAKAEADVRMKMLEMDSQNWREAAGNTTAMMREMMQQGGQDRREQFSQDSQNYRAQLQAQAQGKLSQSQGYELLGEALGMVPQNEADYALKAQRLSGASQALGRDFSGLLSQTSTAGSNAALKQAMEFKRDAMAMLKQQNDLEMQPIENDIKRLQKQNAQNQAEMAPVEAATKLANLQKTSLEAAQLRDPELQAAKRAEALAKSQDIQRRAGEDQFAAIQKRAQMGATMIGQANQMLANPLAMFDPATKKQANQLIQQGQALQQEAFVSYQRPLLKPAKPGVALNDMGIVEGYKMINGGDLAKAKAMAKADGWILPELGSPKVGMK